MTPNYLRLGQLCKFFGMSRQTCAKYVREMLESDRYKKGAPELNLESNYYSTLCFADYLQNRERLRNRNLSRFLPPYDPRQVAWTLGMGGTDQETERTVNEKAGNR